jgi:hypothetical protein
VKQDVKRALELAASQHPQCQWLTDLFALKNVSTREDARDVFLACKKKSPASLCFTAVLSSPHDDVLLRQCAELGYPLAQAIMADWSSGEERLRFAKSAASQRERDGFYWLGCCYKDGSGCEKDLNKAREFYLIAAQLGEVMGMMFLGQLLHATDPQRRVWWGRAAVLGHAGPFLDNFSFVVEMFNFGPGNDAVVFQIGKALNGRVTEMREIFGSIRYAHRIGQANFAVSFYKSQLAACRRGVHTWSLCCLRLNIYKDIRVFMGKMIWETRELALFDVSSSVRKKARKVQKKARK